jgi:ATP phosphoribosyltransferase regulatory subunit
MTIAPPYDATTLAALDRQTGALLDVFGVYGAERVEPAIVQPAGVFLDRLGEELRRRTYVFTSASGSELCLRPDLTIPTCRAYLARVPRADQPLKLCYAGPVFRADRHAPDAPDQMLHAGVENLAAANAPAADAEALTLTLEALKRTGLREVDITLGDLSLFAALLDALNVPAHWAMRLRRHVWRPAYTGELLKRFTGEAGPVNAFLAHIGTLAPAEARAALRDALAMGGIEPLGTRTMEEITERFLEQAADASATRLPRQAATVISTFLNVKAPVPGAVEAIRKLSKVGGISIDMTLSAFERRLSLIERQGVDLSRATFAAQFGRNMEFYTAFVFECRTSGGDQPIAGGGRYDTLLQALGAPRATPAVGCAIFGERLLAARRAQGDPT